MFNDAERKEVSTVTSDDLKEAFAGESQANRRYLAFARKAEADGFPQIAKLFRAVAEAETVHAHAHLRVLGGLKMTADNLQEAINGEAYEFREMYPKFLAQAQSAGNQGAVMSFKYAMAVEAIHHELYSKALETLKAGKALSVDRIFVCQICGHTVTGDAPDRCPTCGAKQDRFVEVK